MQDVADNWFNAARLILSFVAVLWMVEAVNTLFDHQFNVYGIYPRRLETLPGVVLWPFLHGNFQHLIMNTTPLLILGFFVALRGAVSFIQTTLFILVIGGIGVWVFGREAYHVGASGVVFGYFGFLVAVGLYEKSLGALAIASFAIFYYGGLIYGVLPADGFVSWEGHLFGLLAGVWAARLFALRPQSPGERPRWH